MFGDMDDEGKQCTIDSNVLESVNCFIYLGAQIHTNGKSGMINRIRILIAKMPLNHLTKYGKAILS